jgi:hypothetical protein
MFAHPSDVAYADQAAASLTGVTVRLRRLVPLGRMYVIALEQSTGIRSTSQLEQLAERILNVEPQAPPQRDESL